MKIIEVHTPAIPNAYSQARPVGRNVHRISNGRTSPEHWRNVVAREAPTLVVHVIHPK